MVTVTDGQIENAGFVSWQENIIRPQRINPHTVSISPWVNLPRGSTIRMLNECEIRTVFLKRFFTEESKFFQHKTRSQSERKQFRFILWEGEEMPLNLKEFMCRRFYFKGKKTNPT